MLTSDVNIERSVPSTGTVAERSPLGGAVSRVATEVGPMSDRRSRATGTGGLLTLETLENGSFLTGILHLRSAAAVNRKHRGQMGITGQWPKTQHHSR